MTDTATEIPVAIRYGLRIMRDRVHRLKVTGHDEKAGEVHVNVWLNEDQLNPVYRVVYARNGVAHYCELRNGIRMAEFRIRNGNGQIESTETPRRTLSNISSRKRETVKKINQKHERHILPEESVQSLFVRRIELIEQERDLGDKFIKEPNDYNRVMLGAVRQALNVVEEQIVAAQ